MVASSCLCFAARPGWLARGDSDSVIAVVNDERIGSPVSVCVVSWMLVSRLRRARPLLMTRGLAVPSMTVDVDGDAVTVDGDGVV